jgi:hypothetical protein
VTRRGRGVRELLCPCLNVSAGRTLSCRESCKAAQQGPAAFAVCREYAHSSSVRVKSTKSESAKYQSDNENCESRVGGEGGGNDADDNESHQDVHQHRSTEWSFLGRRISHRVPSLVRLGTTRKSLLNNVNF